MNKNDIIKLAEDILGKEEAALWFISFVPSLNSRPVDLLDTEPGSQLVEQVLLQIKYGGYA